eukprot:SAG11_NODE_24904_length_366_cov_1.067416_2_plen_27_part_01
MGFVVFLLANIASSYIINYGNVIAKSA